MRAVVACAVSLILTGCASSPPTRFYTLDAVPAQSRAPQPGAPLQVAAVHMPASLDRREIVSQSGPNRLEVSDENRWGAPIAEMTRRVLTEDLLERLPAGAVILPDQPAPANANALVLDILRFERDSSGEVILRGSWALLPPQSNAPLAMRNVDLRAAAGADYAAQAQAMSGLVGQLADQIAEALPPVAR